MFSLCVTVSGWTINVPTSISSGQHIVGSWTGTLSSSGSNLDWVGLYHVCDVPGKVAAQWWNQVPSKQTSGYFTTEDSSSHGAWVAPTGYSSTSAPPSFILYYFLGNSYQIIAASPVISVSTASSVSSNYYYSYETLPYYAIPYAYSYSSTGPTGTPTSFPTAVPTAVATPAAPLEYVTLTWTLSSTFIYVEGTWSNPYGSGSSDWIGLYTVGQSNLYYPLWWAYVRGGQLSGSFSTASNYYSSVWKVPDGGGWFVLYYFVDNTYTYVGQVEVTI